MRIKALPVGALAADDCALLLWGVWPNLDVAPKSLGREDSNIRRPDSVGEDARGRRIVALDGTGLHWGMGYHTRAKTEPCLLATRGLRGGYRPTFIRSSSRPWARTARSQTKPTAAFIASIPARSSNCSDEAARWLDRLGQ